MPQVLIISRSWDYFTSSTLRFQSTVFWVAIYNEKKKKKKENNGSEYLGSKPPLINYYKRRAIKHFTSHLKSERVRLILVMLKLFLRAQGSELLPKQEL